MYQPNFGGYQPQQYYPQQMAQPPMPDQLAQLRGMQIPQAQPQPPQSAQSGILWAQGEEGARAYMVAPGSSVLLMDSEAEKFYIKSVDGSGMPQPLRVFAYQEVTGGGKTPSAAPQAAQDDLVHRKDFDALAKLVAEIGAKVNKVSRTKEVKDDE